MGMEMVTGGFIQRTRCSTPGKRQKNLSAVFDPPEDNSHREFVEAPFCTAHSVSVLRLLQSLCA